MNEMLTLWLSGHLIIMDGVFRFLREHCEGFVGLRVCTWSYLVPEAVAGSSEAHDKLL